MASLPLLRSCPTLPTLCPEPVMYRQRTPAQPLFQIPANHSVKPSQYLPFAPPTPRNSPSPPQRSTGLPAHWHPHVPSADAFPCPQVHHQCPRGGHAGQGAHARAQRPRLDGAHVGVHSQRRPERSAPARVAGAGDALRRQPQQMHGTALRPCPAPLPRGCIRRGLRGGPRSG